MKILISGASGLIGRSVSQFWKNQNHELCFLVRRPTSEKNHFYWQPSSQTSSQTSSQKINGAALANVDVVVHLSGESIMGWWTPRKKQRILDSRVQSTQTLVKALKQQPPKLLICASGVGIYGDRQDEILTEESSYGQGFLANTCKAWEQAALELKPLGTRVCCARLGIVLSQQAGMLSQLLPLFKLGLGVYAGAKMAFLSWVSIQEIPRVFDWILHQPTFEGPFNLCSPNPLRQKEFYQTLANHLHRPLWFGLPKGITQKLLGEMGQELLLSSQRSTPHKLMQHGYVFYQPELAPALKDLLH